MNIRHPWLVHAENVFVSEKLLLTWKTGCYSKPFLSVRILLPVYEQSFKQLDSEARRKRYRLFLCRRTVWHCGECFFLWDSIFEHSKEIQLLSNIIGKHLFIQGVNNLWVYCGQSLKNCRKIIRNYQFA